MAPTLPTELIDGIILYVYESYCPHAPFGLCDSVPSCVCKPAWSTIEPLTLVSKTFRALTLQIWLRVCRVHSSREIDVTVKLWPESIDWVERLIAGPRAVEGRVAENRWDFSPFKRLSKLRLACVPQTMENLPIPPFVTGASKVTDLELTGFDALRAHFVKSISPDSFPRLRVLRFAAMSSPCRLCQSTQVIEWYTVSFPGFPLPRRLVYEGGSGLPPGISERLACMSDLHSVQVVLFYEGDTSPELITIAPEEEDGASIAPRSHLYKYRWTSMCELCLWAANGHSHVLSEEDLRRLQMEECAKRPPALRSVEWAFVPYRAYTPLVV